MNQLHPPATLSSFYGKPGFTFIETLVTIAIFALAMGAVSGFIVMGYRTQSYTWQQSQVIGEARRGIETMIKEIREARGGDDGSYIIEKAEDFQFIFYSDIDKDDLTERVRYFIEGTDLKKEVIKPQGFPISYPEENKETFILSQYVRNNPPIFQYFDGCGKELLPLPARLKDTKLMKTYLVVNINPDRPPDEFTLESSVQIRNLKQNCHYDEPQQKCLCQ